MKFGNEPVAVTGDEHGNNATNHYLEIGKAPSVGESGSQKTCLENEPVIAWMACVVRDLMDKKGISRIDTLCRSFFFAQNLKKIPSPHLPPSLASWKNHGPLFC